MKITFFIIFSVFCVLLNFSNASEVEKVCRKRGGDIGSCRTAIDIWLQDINEKALQYYRSMADYTWKISMNINEPDSTDNSGYNIDHERTAWRNDICHTVLQLDLLKLEPLQRKQFYILCRSPSLTSEESKALSTALDEMQTIYTSSEVCIWNLSNSATMEDSIQSYLHFVEELEDEIYAPFKSNFINRAVEISTDDTVPIGRECFSGEPDLEKLMSETHVEEVLRWAWLSWRKKVGPPIRPHFETLVKYKNRAAIRNGYKDLAEVWQGELEMKDLEKLSQKLLASIMPLYSKLHKAARKILVAKYPESFRGIDSNKIPAHLLGNMWSQNWVSLYSMLVPDAKEFDLDKLIKKTNWTTIDMVKRAEDFYSSMGLHQMTEKFWKNSYFGDEDKAGQTKRHSKCHGTAANMFNSDDFRMIYCARLSMDDFYVIHHELGHIEYYMSYNSSLPTLFQEGVNSAFQESIGDSIMYGVYSPQHLNRLGVIPDDLVYMFKNKKRLRHFDPGDRFDKSLLLQVALTKLPQIPFGYLIDRYRWDIFEGKIKPEHYNRDFWRYAEQIQGITPPEGLDRGEDFFDAGAKFHVPDNTPYIRYFLSSFIQIQLFKGLCQWSFFGRAHPDLVLPLPLHRCDIYGSKKAGRQLREMMSKGSSIHWSEALFLITGDATVNSDALLEYFQPLDGLLDSIIADY